jgi:DNA-binding NtrC family response regulator
LRDRKEDIPLLFSYFLARYGWKPDTGQVRISQEAMEMLMEYHWPGNIREMENLVKYLLTVTHSDIILPKDLKILLPDAQHRLGESVSGTSAALPENRPAPRETESLSCCSWEEVERKYIQSLLDRMKWNIAAASRQAGVKRSTFNARLKRLGISKK